MLKPSNRRWGVVLALVIVGAIAVLAIRRHFILKPTFWEWDIAHIRPPERTLNLPKSVQCIQSEVKVDEVSLPVVLVRRVDLALDLDVPDGACATVTKISFSRENGKLSCLLFADRGRRALSVGGLQGISGKPAPDYYQQNGTCPGNRKVGNWLGVTASIDINADGTNDVCFTEHDQNGKPIHFTNHPIDGNIEGIVGCSINDYRYAGILKKKSGIYMGVLVLDMEKYKPIASVDIPVDLVGDQPQCLVDAKTNAVVVLDNALQWMHIIDLQPLIDRNSVSVPKSPSTK